MKEEWETVLNGTLIDGQHIHLYVNKNTGLYNIKLEE